MRKKYKLNIYKNGDFCWTETYLEGSEKFMQARIKLIEECGMDVTLGKLDVYEGDTIGRFVFKKRWFSICSKHGQTMKGCHLCMTGNYRNVCKNAVGGLVYKLFPSFWRWRKNPGKKSLYSWWKDRKNYK